MTTKLSVQRFRTRRPDPIEAPAPLPPTSAAMPAAKPTAAPQPQPTAKAGKPATQPKIGDRAFFPTDEDDGFAGMRFPTAAKPDAAAAADSAPADIDTIRQEGLTGRQLRMARRLAQKHGLPATSDFDAVRLLRNAGIDPFQANSVLELVSSGDGPPKSPGSRALTVTPGGDGVQLPQTIKPIQLPSTEEQIERAHFAEVGKIQRDIVARRRKKSLLLAARMFVFVMLPTILAGIYYYTIATPLYSSRTEFVIQQNDAAPSGLSSMLKGSAMATSQDSITVQGYLQSQDAMERLDKDLNFRAHFSGPNMDALQRLAPDATQGAVYKLYHKFVKISYDPTEGVVKMEVIAADPQTAVKFSNALLGYAEERVDMMTARVRDDQMKGARESYDEAEAKLKEANETVVGLQEKTKVLSSEVEISLITAQIGQLDTQLTTERLSLAQMEANSNPNQARMEPVKRRIATLEDQTAQLRAKLTENDANGQSLARVQSELLVAQAEVQTRQLMLAQSLQATELARNEANRQTRYLSVSVNPVEADEAAYPRAFESTLVVMLILIGIYLMITMTIAILYEQVTSG
ncbi:capsule polysaccharide transporter [Cypionkella aquatica]|uniref:Capsule polysaccharide transporter n=1 Tax=Cypionkella aquatica TaxID=1756042 RepID=A0AA37TVN7_9RHOB|nr:capsule biosynthesis protein [Cypionkella aquatica]GLS85151.1 capsule polysaccharide transporter [Cypionkella aquatica]GLS86723.1 capsule polysaccharide transporter [Cypionkella aquatica]